MTKSLFVYLNVKHKDVYVLIQIITEECGILQTIVKKSNY